MMELGSRLNVAKIALLVMLIESTPGSAVAGKEPGVNDFSTCASLATVVTPDGRALLKLLMKHVRAERLGQILPGERCMVKAAATGRSIWLDKSFDDDDPGNDPTRWISFTVSTQRPESEQERRLIRADVLRWLSLNDKAQKFIDPMGIRLGAAIVQGTLDLSYANVLTALTLNYSALGPVKLRYSTARTIDFSASTAQFVDATSPKINGDVLFTQTLQVDR